MTQHLRDLQLVAADLTQAPEAWRHHGTGMLQCYVSPAHRIHVWHPSLLLEGMTERGAWHDHRFNLISTVLAVEDGQFLHSNIYFANASSSRDLASIDKKCDLWQVPGASQGKTEDLERVEEAVPTIIRDAQVLKAGESYSLARGTFHWARSTGLAITSCLIHNKLDCPAHILTPAGVEPVHAFEKTVDADRIDYLLSRARYVLTAAAKEGT